jgi:hypothetical protein
MGTNPKAEFLARIARHKELIETATKTIEHSTRLIKQSRRLVRIAMSHNVNGGNNRKKHAPISSDSPSQRCEQTSRLRNNDSLQYEDSQKRI